MTVQQFNLLPINGKWNYIKNQLCTQPYGIVNRLLLSDKTIYFQICVVSGKLLKAEAKEMPEDELQELKNSFGEFEGLLINFDQTEMVKKYLFKGALKLGGQNN